MRFAKCESLSYIIVANNIVRPSPCATQVSIPSKTSSFSLETVIYAGFRSPLNLVSSYKSSSCTIGSHETCALSAQCRCHCHDMEKRKKELEHYKSLDCKWGNHKECHNERGHCSCECHRSPA